MDFRLSARMIDCWAWLDVPPVFLRVLRASATTPLNEMELIPEGRHKWFLCITPKAMKLRGNNRVQVLDVLRGRQIFGANDEPPEASKNIRTGVFICRLIVHDCGVFHIHDVSPMEDFDVGFCPVLPRVIRYRLDVAYSRYSKTMTYEREAAKPFSFVQPPPLLHNLASVDLDVINSRATTDEAVVDLTVPSAARNEDNVLQDVMGSSNKAVTVASISCSTMIPRVVSMAARAAVMSFDNGKPVATVTDLNPCVTRRNSTLVGNRIMGEDSESTEDSSDSEVEAFPGSEGE